MVVESYWFAFPVLNEANKQKGKRSKMTTTKLSVCFLTLAALAATAAIKPTALTGAWRVTEVRTTGPNAATNSNPQPGLYIFTGNHYSTIMIQGQGPRPELGDGAQAGDKATADQLRALWGPLTANSGTYEISGGNVTFHAAVAKNPGVMAAGNASVSSFKIEKDKLTLVTVRTGRGPVGNPTTTTLTRVE